MFSKRRVNARTDVKSGEAVDPEKYLNIIK